MAELVTTLGSMTLADVAPGAILPHEHIFVDLRTPDHADHEQADTGDVVRLMAPELTRARDAGVAALVTCTPVGVGRRADLDLAVSRAAGLPVLVPTGVYREPWIPAWVRDATEDELVEWMVAELEEGIAGTGIRAAWIKLSAGDDGITRCERRVLRAAGRAGAISGVAIGSHTIRGHVVMEQLDVLESVGYDPHRFIWIHTQAEPDLAVHRRVAARGAWLEYDAIGSGIPDETFVDLVTDGLAAGDGDSILLSHDRGWYDPAKAGGGTPKPFTYLTEVFLPKLARAGISKSVVAQLTRDNPFRAFAR